MSNPDQPNSLVERLDALYEYDREPVTANKLHGVKTFIGMFAGEHVAGTEFVIGPLFVAHGVSAVDFFCGLFFGNLLAVLSWALFCAPIGVKTRLTIYWQIRKICGPYLTVVYSAFYALVLCLLAGAMVNVAVSAVGIPFGIPNPDFAAGEYFPGPSWIVLAVILGVVTSLLAVLGFEKMAHFAKVCAPWMFLVFVACGLSVLPSLGCTSVGSFWEVATTKIWTGVPMDGVSKYTFWHVLGFAWLCNITQHMGMADMTIFRYAKKWQYGFTSAFGMYLGHFIAWIASGIMCAAALGDRSPGTIAFLGAGWAGAVCVVIASWTTANPTLYRAGLAFQVATPNWKRWKVTFLAGALMIIAACIPAVIYYLDRIVGFYGLFFMPLGAFIFIDVWLFPRLGLRSSYAEKIGALVSWPAALAWSGSFLTVLLMYGKDNYAVLSWVNNVLPAAIANHKVDLFFMVLPEWLLAITLYTLFSFIQQRAFASKPLAQEA